MSKKEKNEQEIVEETVAEETTAEVSAEEQLTAELNETKDSLLRLAAEYDNFKKRSDREKEQLTAFVKAEMMKKMLPVVDNIAFAEKSDVSSPDYAKGLEMIVKQLKETLSKIGLEEIEALGKPFDPNLHEAVMHVEDENFGENEVADVLQAGYKIGDTVIRPSMVKVAN